MSPEQFGRMSLGFYALLCRELEEAEIRHHYPAAAIQATLANINRDSDKKPDPFSPWEFIPGYTWKTEEPKTATVEELITLFGAKDTRRARGNKGRGSNRASGRAR